MSMYEITPNYKGLIWKKYPERVHHDLALAIKKGALTVEQIHTASTWMEWYWDYTVKQGVGREGSWNLFLLACLHSWDFESVIQNQKPEGWEFIWRCHFGDKPLPEPIEPEKPLPETIYHEVYHTNGLYTKNSTLETRVKGIAVHTEVIGKQRGKYVRWYVKEGSELGQQVNFIDLLKRFYPAMWQERRLTSTPEWLQCVALHTTPEHFYLLARYEVIFQAIQSVYTTRSLLGEYYKQRYPSVEVTSKEESC